MDDFKAARQRYADLNAQWQAGTLDEASFIQEVHKLRLRDDQEAWWQIDPATGAWLYWEDSAWQTGCQPPGALEATAFCTACGNPLAEGARFCSACGATASDDGPEPDDPGEPAGPQRICSACQAASAETDTRCAGCGAALDGGHWRVTVQAKGAGSAGRRAQQPPAWKNISLKGPMVVALTWFAWSFIAILRNGVAPDFLSPLAMVGIPWAINKKHADIDRFLIGLTQFQAFRRRIPRGLRAGIGLAMPLLITPVLYAFGIKEFPLMFSTILTSVPLSYALLREPAKTALQGRSIVSGGGA